MKKRESKSAVPNASVVVSKGSELRISALWKSNGYRIYNGMGVHLKKNCEAARGPIFVAIPFDHLGIKKEQWCKRQILAMVRQRLDEMVRRRELPCVRRSSSLYSELVVRGVVPMSMERKKVMEKQRRSRIDGKKWIFVDREIVAEVEILLPGMIDRDVSRTTFQFCHPVQPKSVLWLLYCHSPITVKVSVSSHNLFLLSSL
jgi:hypothetical protein